MSGRLVGRLVRWSVRLVGTAIIALALLLGLFRVLLPLAPSYQAQIERWAGEALDVRVMLDAVDARWPLLAGPELVFEDAQLWSPDGSALLLTAQSGAVALDLVALLSRFELKPGRVLLKGVVIDVEHDTGAGGWQVLGRAVPAGATAEAGTARSAALPRGTLDLQDATIVIQDDRAGSDAAQELTGVRLTYEHRRGYLRLDGSLRPGGLGSHLDFSLQGQALRDGMRRGRWQLFLDGQGLDFDAIAAATPTLAGVGGRGDVRLWLGSRDGRLEQASLALALDGLVLPAPAEDSAPPHYDRVDGYFDLTMGADGWSLRGNDIALVRDGRRWPATDLAIDVGGDGALGVRADYLRLEDVAPLAPILRRAGAAPADLLARLLAALPRGELSRLRASRSDGGGLAVAVSFQGLAVAAPAGGARATGLSGAVDLAGDAGTLSLDAPEVVLRLPSLFDAALPPAAIQGTVSWQRGDGRHEFDARKLRIETAAIRGEGSLALHLPHHPDAMPDGPWLDLQLALRDVEPALLAPYVPTRVLTERVGGWLQRALRAGTVPRASVSFTGPVRAFPFEQGEGSFRAEAEVEDVEFQYAMGWPRARGLSGVVSFENASMVGEGVAGEVKGNRVRSLRVEIPDVREGVLEYHSRTRGPVPAVIAYLRDTPYARYVELLEDTAGAGEVTLDFTLPLKRQQDAVLSAELAVADGALALEDVPAAFREIVGRLRYETGDGLTGSGIRARFLDRPVTLDLIPEKAADGRLLASRLQVEGRYELGHLARPLDPVLAARVSGTSRVVATARLRPRADRLRDVTIRSDLVGTRLELPAPLTKAADTALPAAVKLSSDADGAVTVGLDLGQVARARAELVGDGKRSGVVRGSVTLGGGEPILPRTEGLVIEGRARRLDLSDWLSLAAHVSASRPSSGPPVHEALAGGGAPSAAAPRRPAAALPALPLTRVDLALDEVRLAGQRFQDLALRSARSAGDWRLRIDGQGVAGELFLPRGGGSGAMVARFERLHLAGPVPGRGEVPASPAAPPAAGEGDQEVIRAATANEVAGRGAAAAGDQVPLPLDPRTVPTLVVQVDDFAWEALRIGEVGLELQSMPNGVALPRLSVDGPSLRIEGEGEWIVTGDGSQRSRLDLDMRSSDLLESLEQLDFEGTISAEAASLQASLLWDGAPSLTLDDRLSGEVSVSVGPGQLMNVRPGAGKIFGLLSVAALPRRLELDFRDVFEKGLGFDEITGTFTIDHGQAYTDDLRLVGQTADVSIVGRTGLATRDYDQTAVVAANVGTPLPLAGAIAGGPVVGAALLIFSEIIKEPLKDLSRTQYRITGPWDDPSVRRVAMPTAPAGDPSGSDAPADASPARAPRNDGERG